MDSEKQNGLSTKQKRYSADRKLEILKDYENTKNRVETAKKYGICPSSFSRWKNQYEKNGLAGLQNKPSRPNRQPKKTSQWIINKIVDLKKETPEIGICQVKDRLARFSGIQLSRATINKIFKKNSLPDSDQVVAEKSYYVKGDKDGRLEQEVETEIGEWERFCRPNPNDLWQMDLMYFHIREAHRVYLISALDDCSRMIVNWGLFKEQTAENVLEVLKGALAKHGAPKEILTDQGSQFKHWHGVTEFEKLLKKLGVQHIKARSHHPQTCGKIEAFHKTIHRELLDIEYFISQEQATQKIGRFIEHYNYARPHSSLQGFTPSDRYFGVIESLKKYLDDFKLPKNEAEEGEGKISLGRKSKIYLIGKFLDQDIRIQELYGQISIHINDVLVKEINLSSPVTH